MSECIKQPVRIANSCSGQQEEQKEDCPPYLQESLANDIGKDCSSQVVCR